MAAGGGSQVRPERPESLAKLLRTWRERAILTQEQLAERAGVSVGTVRGVESGRIRRPRSDSLRLLADGLELSEAERSALVASGRGLVDGPGGAPEGGGTDAPNVGSDLAQSPPAVPAQLPADLSGFTGRDSYLKELDELAPSEVDGGGAAVVISAIAGMAGIGKTALALHWAHRVRDRFPDGQLYVNLRGYSAAQPMRPLEALSGFLLGLGVPAELVPVELEQAGAMFRSRLAVKRVLVVLDNAASAAQARPLLPGVAGCLVVVTSRDRLSGLVASHGAHRISLDMLTPPEARELLVAVLGADRVAADTDALDALARCCGYLPLALRIAAAHLLDQPGRPVADLVAELDRDRLSTLEVAGDEQNAVRAAFDLSYAALPAEARRVFRLLGLVPGPDVTVEAVAALAGIPQRPAQRLLDGLAASHLVLEHTAGRYALHDLLRQYAADRVVAEDGQEARDMALGRLFDWYVASTGRTADLLYGEMLRLDLPANPQRAARLSTDGTDGATAWLRAEQANLIAAIRHTASVGPHRVAWLLADALRGFFYRGRATVHWLDVASAGLAAAEAEGDGRAMAAMHLNLGSANFCLERWDLAVHHLALSRDLAQQAGWEGAAARIATNLAILHCELGEPRAALAEMDALLGKAERTANPHAVASLLGNIGWIHRESGLAASAGRHLHRALTLHRELGHDGRAGIDLENLGVVCHDLGRLNEACEHLTAALAIHVQMGARQRGRDPQALRRAAKRSRQERRGGTRGRDRRAAYRGHQAAPHPGRCTQRAGHYPSLPAFA
jgi:transcriptional regulator with XRE-family HTH domain/tetratricopeptide (TPR) repeat protein